MSRYGRHPYYETTAQRQRREYLELVNGPSEGNAPASRVDCVNSGSIQGKRY